MNIKELTHPTVKQLRQKIQESLDSIGKEIGISFDLGSMRFRPNSGTVKLSFTLSKDGIPINKLEQDFKDYFLKHGIPLEYLGKPFKTFSGNQMTLIGYRPRATKLPFVGRNSQGTEYIFGRDQIINGFKRNGNPIFEDVQPKM